MSAPLTVPLEALVRAHAALQAVQRIQTGEPIPFPTALQVAGALGFMNQAMQSIGRTAVEVQS